MSAVRTRCTKIRCARRPFRRRRQVLWIHNRLEPSAHRRRASHRVVHVSPPFTVIERGRAGWLSTAIRVNDGLFGALLPLYYRGTDWTTPDLVCVRISRPLRSAAGITIWIPVSAGTVEVWACERASTIPTSIILCQNYLAVRAVGGSSLTSTWVQNGQPFSLGAGWPHFSSRRPPCARSIEDSQS